MTDQGRLRWRIVEKPHIRIINLIGIPDIQTTFDRYKLEWMGEPSESSIPELVCEFYISYDASIDLITPMRQRS